MPENKHLRFLLTLLYTVLGILGAWLAFRFLLPWLLPFLIALCLAALLEKPVLFLMRRLKLSRWVSSAVCTVALGLILLALLALAAWRLWYETALLLERLPSMLSSLPNLGSKWENWVYRFVTAAPIPMQEYLSGVLESLAAQSASLPAALYGWVVKWAAAAAAAVPDFFLALFTTAIATYFSSSTRPALMSFLRRQVPRSWRSTVRRGGARLRRTFGGWLKAQGILLLITFFEL
ncbi:MAG: AI-2E family transporter, partial [Clostridia bacterium]|nr:AI-2E family transporter [Clostridia bacterium]